MVRRNIAPSIHLGFQPPSLRRNAAQYASQYAWSRPVRNGAVAKRVTLWEPPIWIGVPIFAFLGWMLSVLALLW